MWKKNQKAYFWNTGISSFAQSGSNSVSRMLGELVVGRGIGLDVSMRKLIVRVPPEIGKGDLVIESGIF